MSRPLTSRQIAQAESARRAAVESLRRQAEVIADDSPIDSVAMLALADRLLAVDRLGLWLTAQLPGAERLCELSRMTPEAICAATRGNAALGLILLQSRAAAE